MARGIVDVGEEDFDARVMASADPVLVDFHAQWCAPCRWVEPFLEELAREYQGELLVVRVDTDLAPGIAQRFGVRSVPTLLFLRGGKERGRSLGFEPERVRALALEVMR